MAGALAVAVMRREARRAGLPPTPITDLTLFVFLFGLIGARLLHVVADGELTVYYLRCTDPALVPGQARADCLAVFRVWEGGLAFYGGALVGGLFAWTFVRRRGLPVLRTLDLVGLAAPLALAAGRVGCHFQGCCYGKPTPWAWGIAATTGVSVHPAQLVQAGANLAIFVLLYFVLRPRQRRNGQIFALFLILYAVTRSLTELLRGDPRGGLVGLSTAQWLSLPVLALGVALLLRAGGNRPEPTRVNP